MSLRSPIVFHFIRNVNEESRDDVLTILPSRTIPSVYDLTYTDELCSIKNKFSSVEDGVFDYVNSLFDLLTVDTDPFRSVQVTFPGFPSIMLDTPHLKDRNVQRGIKRMLYATLRCFPARLTHTGRGISSANRTQVHEGV